MNTHRLRATGLLTAGVLAGGILAGALAAHAADEETSRAGAPHVRVHFEGGPGSADLAKDLGVSEKQLREAFEAIHDAVKPPEPPSGPPSETEMKAMHDKMTAALAKELGISQSKVEAAFEKQRTRMEADHRSELSKRLDDAVNDGKLTADDKKSVLKAFDAGILQGPRRMMIGG
jgi:hypothetical protein